MTGLLPPEAALRRLARLRLQWHVSLSMDGIGTRRGSRRGASREFLGLRPYEPGDDPRDLDRRATVRFERPHVRVYRSEREASVLLVIDTSASMGHGAPSKLAYAQALACSLAYLALAHHDRVGLVTLGNGGVRTLSAGRGRGQWPAVVRLVSGLVPDGRAALDAIPLGVVGSRIPGLVLVMSDFYPPERFVTGLKRLALCPTRVVAIQLVSPDELGPSLDGEVELVDLESGETRTGWIGSAERAHHRQALERVAGAVAAAGGRRGLTSVRLSTDVPLTRCLDEHLVRAGVLRHEVS
jgi:uncharacterized protein (DUF58 family)